MNDDDLLLQTTDKWYQKLVEHVNNYTQQYPLWIVDKGRQHKKYTPRYLDLTGTIWLVLVPKERRKDINKDNHDPSLSGLVFLKLQQVSLNIIIAKASYRCNELCSKLHSMSSNKTRAKTPEGTHDYCSTYCCALDSLQVWTSLALFYNQFLVVLFYQSLTVLPSLSYVSPLHLLRTVHNFEVLLLKL